MSENRGSGFNEEMLNELEKDLPSIACFAAIELDNIFLGSDDKVKSIERLVGVLSGPFVGQTSDPQAFMVEPATSVAMSQAIDASHLFEKPMKTIDDLIKESNNIIDKLKKIAVHADNEINGNKENVKKLRQFCINLSRGASSYEQSPHDSIPAL